MNQHQLVDGELLLTVVWFSKVIDFKWEPLGVGAPLLQQAIWVCFGRVILSKQWTYHCQCIAYWHMGWYFHITELVGL